VSDEEVDGSHQRPKRGLLRWIKNLFRKNEPEQSEEYREPPRRKSPQKPLYYPSHESDEHGRSYSQSRPNPEPVYPEEPEYQVPPPASLPEEDQKYTVPLEESDESSELGKDPLASEGSSGTLDRSVITSVNSEITKTQTVVHADMSKVQSVQQTDGHVQAGGNSDTLLPKHLRTSSFLERTEPRQTSKNYEASPRHHANTSPGAGGGEEPTYRGKRSESQF
jgi:hypothetical protein